MKHWNMILIISNINRFLNQERDTIIQIAFNNVRNLVGYFTIVSIFMNKRLII